MTNGLSLLLLISALVACTGFVGLYATHSPWRINPAGKSMMLLAVSLIAIILSGIFLNAFGPNYPGRAFVRLASYALLNVALWRQLFLLIKVQNAALRPATSHATVVQVSGEELVAVVPDDLPSPRQGPDTGEIEAQDKTTVL